MGSNADNGSGGGYAYRASKAALNIGEPCRTSGMDNKGGGLHDSTTEDATCARTQVVMPLTAVNTSMSIDLKDRGVTSVLLHPVSFAATAALPKSLQ